MEKLGKYTIVEKIGVGGFGEVYKGYDPFIKRYIAVKTCSTNDQEVRTRFFQEAEIAGNLHHRNVTTVHDFGIQDDLPYLIQEYLSGEDLDRKIKRRDFLPFPEKLYYLLQIARGLGYAHSRGIIHRDIKPANIRVLEDGTTKIMDFGIARLAQQETGLTQTGMTLGTAAYLAPEQIRGDKIDLRTDIFSFGVLAYELLAYERPFPGKQISTVLFSILNDEPKPLLEHWPGAPEDILALTHRCLEKDPQKRFADGNEVSRELERIQKRGRPGGQVDDGPTVFLTPGASAAQGFPSPSGTVGDPPPPGGAQAFPSPSGQVGAPPPPPALKEDSSASRASADLLRTAAQQPLRPSTDSHALDQLELTSNPAESEREATATRRVVTSDAIPRNHHSGKTAAIIVLALLAGIAGWWFGTQSPAAKPGDATTTSTPAVDVPLAVGETQPETAQTEDNPKDGETGLGGPSSTASNEPSVEASEPPPPPPPPAPAKLTLQKVPWTDRMVVELAGKRYPLIKAWNVSLDAGRHRVVFRLDMPGYTAEESLDVRLRAGESQKLQCPIGQPGALSVWALPGRRQGEVVLDGTVLGASPIRQYLLAPGDHTMVVQASADDPAAIEQQVAIVSGIESVISFDLDAGRSTLSSKELTTP